MKVIINKSYGGFGLSNKAIKHYKKLKGSMPKNIKRNDPFLVKTVEDLGGVANGNFCKLAIIEISDGIDYTIEEYDGMEWVAEKHRTWS